MKMLTGLLPASSGDGVALRASESMLAIYARRSRRLYVAIVLAFGELIVA